MYDIASISTNPNAMNSRRCCAAAGCQHVLDYAKAEREAAIQPHRMHDDLGGKTVAVAGRITASFD